MVGPQKRRNHKKTQRTLCEAPGGKSPRSSCDGSSRMSERSKRSWSLTDGKERGAAQKTALCNTDSIGDTQIRNSLTTIQTAPLDAVNLMVTRAGILLFLLLFVGNSNSECVDKYGNTAICNSIQEFADDTRFHDDQYYYLYIKDCTNDTLDFGNVSFSNIAMVEIFCPVTSVVGELVVAFPNAKGFALNQCVLKHLDWQTIYTRNMKNLYVRECPLSCECLNHWATLKRFPGMDGIPDHFYKCKPDCIFNELVTKQTRYEPKIGEDIHISIEIHGLFTNKTWTKKQYFTFEDAKYEDYTREIVERVNETHAELFIRNITNRDLRYVYFICYHCLNFKYQTFQILVPTPPVLTFYPKMRQDPGLDQLRIRAHPISPMNLTITRHDLNITETHEIEANKDHRYFKNFIVRDYGNRNSLKVLLRMFSDPHQDTGFVHGNASFTVCTPSGCTTKTHFINHAGPYDASVYRPFGIYSKIAHFQSIITKKPWHMLTTTTAEPNIASHLSTIVSVIWVFLIFAVLLTLGIYLFGMRKPKRVPVIQLQEERRVEVVAVEKEEEEQEEEEEEEEVPAPTRNPPSIRRPSNETEQTLLKLEEQTPIIALDYVNRVIPFINSSNVRIKSIIGRGAFGDVYSGIWDKTNEPVAIKTLRPDAAGDIEKEAKIASKLEHPNIVKFYGVMMDRNHLVLVFEMMNRGDLLSYLRNRTPKGHGYNQFPPPLLLKELVKICVDVITAVSYLASQQIVHRDIAARNFLVSGDDDQKIISSLDRPPIIIADFGMSKQLYCDRSYYPLFGENAIPLRWLAPESIRRQKFDHMSDVWSLGVTLWEIFTYGKVPYEHLSNQELSHHVQQLLPFHHDIIPNEFYNMMLKCWEYDANKRPTAEDLLADPLFAEYRRAPTQQNNGACKTSPTKNADDSEVCGKSNPAADVEEHTV
ncbi:unnamed protein product [Caenorhabditis bovis]|uniref:Protein kinase domain-containing protein n=1 Tax=Caenorhabditis bovis TaxID=2654633 RepID=A0A8S1E777_9PELO|nr:unnamed protein product [Caenorhabditis bovis]